MSTPDNAWRDLSAMHRFARTLAGRLRGHNKTLLKRATLEGTRMLRAGCRPNN